MKQNISLDFLIIEIASSHSARLSLYLDSFRALLLLVFIITKQFSPKLTSAYLYFIVLQSKRIALFFFPMPTAN